MANRIQVRRDTAAEWAAVNPVLAQGEPGLEKVTGKIKYGDGATPWNDLPYASEGPEGPAGVADDASVAQQVTSGPATTAALNATYATRASAPFTINTTDSSGNPTSITYHVAGGDVTTTYTYGANGVATETTAGQTITYTYDGSGNLTGAV
ncbi:hypothetical protein [Arthrobacter sp. SAFR-014]|uniref:hyaluronate lyase N-terminal domain-containing protein n=1 Tax=unclassified Arthrobacter TaxID=235627 RepID=UPI003F7C799B